MTRLGRRERSCQAGAGNQRRKAESDRATVAVGLLSTSEFSRNRWKAFAC